MKGLLFDKVRSLRYCFDSSLGESRLSSIHCIPSAEIFIFEVNLSFKFSLYKQIENLNFYLALSIQTNYLFRLHLSN